MAESPIVGVFGRARSQNAADSECMNLYVEVIDTKDGKVPGYMLMAPGLNRVVTVGAGPIRGLHAFGAYLIAVSGGEIYAVDQNLNVYLAGSAATSTGAVAMIDNGNQVAIFDGYAGYLTTPRLITDGGYPLTGGTIGGTTTEPNALLGGGLDYMVGDTIQLAQVGGVQDSSAIVTVTNVQNVTVNGSGYAVNDTGIVQAGNQDATYIITSIGLGGTVTGYTITAAGTGYPIASNVPTITGGAQPGIGNGFALEITGTTGSGQITSTSAATSTYPGVVTSFLVTQQGAFSEKPTSFTQFATSGTGSGFVLGNPTYSGVVNQVQIELPFEGPLAAVQQDGFGVVSQSDTNTMWQSNIDDLSVFNPLNFDVADSTPDPIVAMADLAREIWVMKAEHTEVWDNAGTAGFTFQRQNGVFMETGCGAAASLTKAGQSLLWLAQNDQGDRFVVQANGYNPVAISTHAVDTEISKYTEIADAIGYAYEQEGHLFYVLTFPTGDATWALDITTTAKLGYPAWAKRGSYSNGNFHRHLGNCFALFRAQGQNYQPKGIFLSTSSHSGQGLITTGNLTGLPPKTSTFVISGWFNQPDLGAENFGFVFDNFGTLGSTNSGNLQYSIFNSSGTLFISLLLYDASGAQILNGLWLLTSFSAWFWVGISVNTSDETVQVAVNGGFFTEILPNTYVIWYQSVPVPFNTARPWEIYAYNGISGYPTQLYISDFLFSPTANFIDLSDASNQQLFISASNGAIQLGNGSPALGTQAAVYLTVSDFGTSLATNSFASNQGYGGAFNILEGPLSYAISDPPNTPGSPSSLYPLVGDYQSGNLLEFDLDQPLDNGQQRKWVRSWRASPQPLLEPRRFPALTIDVETGTQVPDGTAPNFMLRWSDDGGHNWTDYRIVPAGQTGQTAQRIMFKRLGSTKRDSGLDRIFELSSADPFKVAILRAQID